MLFELMYNPPRTPWALIKFYWAVMRSATRHRCPHCGRNI